MQWWGYGCYGFANRSEFPLLAATASGPLSQSRIRENGQSHAGLPLCYGLSTKEHFVSSQSGIVSDFVCLRRGRQGDAVESQPIRKGDRKLCLGNYLHCGNRAVC